MQISDNPHTVLGLDIGDARIGVARANSLAKLPDPLEVIELKTTDAYVRIAEIIALNDVGHIVVGLPVLASGDDSPQTKKVRDFTAILAKKVAVPISYVNELFSSVYADTYLKDKKWQGQPSNDALAACVLLQRYFDEGGQDV